MNKLKSPYIKSFLVPLSVILIGFIIEYFRDNKEILLPSFPVNLYILLIFLFYLIFTFVFFRKTELLSWFIKIPSTIAVITVYTLMVLLMGFVPQIKGDSFIDKIGITNITSSIPFMLINVLLLMVLAYTIINRLTKKLNLKNIAFFLNHAGLFIIIIGGYIGSADMQTLTVPIKEGESTNIAFSDKDQAVKIPFYIKLNDFIVDEYPAELVLFEKETGKVIEKEKNKDFYLKKGKTIEVQSIKIDVLEYFQYAFPVDSGFISSDKFGSVHAAYIKIQDDRGEKKGWIATGNFMFNPVFLTYNNKIDIELMEPSVRKFQSVIDIIEDNNSMKGLTIEVNKPFNYKGWKLYQSSYDKQLGRWSETSVFQMVKDPWLPVVYTGIFMLLLGSCYLIIFGRRTQ